MIFKIKASVTFAYRVLPYLAKYDLDQALCYVDMFIKKSQYFEVNGIGAGVGDFYRMKAEMLLNKSGIIISLEIPQPKKLNKL